MKFVLAAALLGFVPFAKLGAQTNQPTAQASPRLNGAALRTERLFAEAQQCFRAAPTNVEAAWQFGRAAFDRAEFATNNAHRAALAEMGIAACRLAVARDPKAAPAHYYLALNLGQSARTKTLGAIRLVKQMEAELKTAIALDPDFDYAGAHRSLGLLYLEAPGWPTSIGSRAHARIHLRKAVDLAPDYPENRLCLLEACLAWGEKRAVQAELKVTEEMLEKARDLFAGEQWRADWEDWEKRWAKIKAKAAESPTPLKAPREKSS